MLCCPYIHNQRIKVRLAGNRWTGTDADLEGFISGLADGTYDYGMPYFLVQVSRIVCLDIVTFSSVTPWM